MNVTKSRNVDAHWYSSIFQIAAKNITFSLYVAEGQTDISN